MIILKNLEKTFLVLVLVLIYLISVSARFVAVNDTLVSSVSEDTSVKDAAIVKTASDALTKQDSTSDKQTPAPKSVITNSTDNVSVSGGDSIQDGIDVLNGSNGTVYLNNNTYSSSRNTNITINAN